MTQKVIELTNGHHQELIDELAKLYPYAIVSGFSIKAHPSIWEDANMKGVAKTFYPDAMTVASIFTRGTSFARFAETFNQLVANSKHITGTSIKISKPWKSWVAQSYRNDKNPYLNTDEEYNYVTYHVVITVDGITPAAIKAEQERKAERERIEQERIARDIKIAEHIEYYKNLNKDEEYIHVGGANSWISPDKAPEIVKIADADKDHYYERINIGHCLTRYVSHKYKFTFTVDSSD